MATRPAHGSSVGIDDMALYVPRHYLPVRLLAEARGIEPEKLSVGLGLESMALPDTFEDTATMAANAVRTLIERNGLDPRTVGRIYLGTESALDGAKPTATYVLEMLRRHYREAHGTDCLDRCDVIDMTFACIGAVDALLNTADWVRAGSERIAIVVASDFAKYELGSPGEYTQGAGAIAMLVRENPRLLALQPEVGVSTRGVHDFFKPVLQVPKADIIREVLKLLPGESMASEVLQQLDTGFARKGVLDANDERIGVHVMTPTFDGPYSNYTYTRRVREAYAHYVEQVGGAVDDQPVFSWARVVMHLPYAAHGRRMLTDLFVRELQRQGAWAEIAEASKLPPAPEVGDYAQEALFDQAWEAYLRPVGKSAAYRSFAGEQLRGTSGASSSVGNAYAGAIFLALMSTLSEAATSGQQLAGKTLGFLAYGSGSKSKVFVGSLRGTWEGVVAKWKLDEQLAARKGISYELYERLHRGRLSRPLAAPSGTFVLDRIGTEGNRRGARYYEWVDGVGP